MISSGTSDIFSKYNRDTGRLAAVVLGAMVVGALALAFLVQQHDQSNSLLTKDGVKISADYVYAINSAPDEVSSGTEGAPWTPDSILASVPAKNDNESTGQLNSGNPPAPRAEPKSNLRGTRGKSHSAGRPKLISVKMRLVALWHLSLARAEKSRGWALGPNSTRENTKKVSYTAETTH